MLKNLILEILDHLSTGQRVFEIETKTLQNNNVE